MTTPFDFSPAALAALAQTDAARALAEDVGAGDLTAGLIDATTQAKARVLAREAAVICGAPWVQATLQQVDPSAHIRWLVGEGVYALVLLPNRRFLVFSAASPRTIMGCSY